MKIFGKIFLLLLIITFTCCLSNAQDKIDTKATQEYIYEDSFLILKFKSNGVKYFTHDKVKIELEVENISNNPVFLFPTAYFDTIKFKDKYLYDIGGEFISYIDHEVEMNKLDPGKKTRYECGFTITKEYINIHLSFGYIPSLDWIDKYLKVYKGGYKYSLNKDVLSISSWLVELFVRKITGGNLWISLLKQ
jgi:hypothetical protein